MHRKSLTSFRTKKSQHWYPTSSLNSHKYQIDQYMRKLILLAASLASIVSCNNAKKAKTAETEPEPQYYIALSFDDGPNLTTTPAVLDVLEANGVPASFFVIGQNINDESAEMMKRAVSLGCEIENHSLTHTHMPTLTAEQIADEIAQTSALVKKHIGREPQFFRPPYISVNDTMHEVISLPFICGHGCNDWVSDVTAEQRLTTLLDEISDGDIILLHDFEGNEATAKALKTFIPEMKARGYGFVTVSELFRIKDVNPVPHADIVYTNLIIQK